MADKVPATHPIKAGFAVASFGFVCMYLYRSADGIIAFDTGMKPASVLSELRKLQLDPSEVRHVFITHSDSDHVGGLAAFPEAEVYFPEAEIPMVTREVPRFLGFIYNRPMERSYRTVSDGERIGIGETVVTCLSTPGHTSGSMSFLVDNSILIVGDELGLKNGKAVLNRRVLAIDNRKREESIAKLAELRGVSFLCTMHHGYTEDGDAALDAWRTGSH